MRGALLKKRHGIPAALLMLLVLAGVATVVVIVTIVCVTAPKEPLSFTKTDNLEIGYRGESDDIIVKATNASTVKSYGIFVDASVDETQINSIAYSIEAIDGSTLTEQDKLVLSEPEVGKDVNNDGDGFDARYNIGAGSGYNIVVTVDSADDVAPGELEVELDFQRKVAYPEVIVPPTSYAVTEGVLVFDGENDYVRILEDPDFDFENQVTISVMAKPEPVDHSTNLFVFGRSYRVILGNDMTARLRVRLHFSEDLGQITLETEENDFKVGEWNHVVFTYKTDVGPSAYINGRSLTWTSGVLNAWPPLNDDVINECTFGARWGGDAPFPGTISEVRLYNRALSPEEITVLPSDLPVDDSLVGRWEPEGTGQTVVDTSGHNNDGVLGRGPDPDPCDPKRATIEKE